MDAYNTIEYRGETIELYFDEDPESPREWDNLGTMVCFHREYILGDKHDFRDAEEFHEYMEAHPENIYIPLYLYDHSGISMSTGSFNDPWDSGQVGYIYITPEKIRQEYSVKRISKQLRNRVIQCLKEEVETYDKYLTGQVFGYVAGEDSCWGFYDEDDMISEAKSAIDYRLEEAQKKHEAKLKAQILHNVPLQYRTA